MIVVLCGAVAAFGVDDISINDTSSNDKVVLLRCCFFVIAFGVRGCCDGNKKNEVSCRQSLNCRTLGTKYTETIPIELTVGRLYRSIRVSVYGNIPNRV